MQINKCGYHRKRNGKYEKTAQRNKTKRLTTALRATAKSRRALCGALNFILIHFKFNGSQEIQFGDSSIYTSGQSLRHSIV